MKQKYILSLEALDDRNLWRLAEQGYRHLYGIGLNNKIFGMPHYTKIKYLIANPSQTHFPEAFFDIIYLAHPSVEITETLMREAARIINDQGTIIITGSPRANSKLIALAEKIGYGTTHKQVSGPKSCSLQSLSRPNPRSRERKLGSVNIVCPTLGRHEGISEYTSHLKARFDLEGIKANLLQTWKKVGNQYPTIIEYEPRLEQDIPAEGFIIEAHRLPSRQSIFVELRNAIKRVIAKPSELTGILRQTILDTGHLTEVIDDIGNERALKSIEKNLLLARSNELAKLSNITNYILMPHIAYAFDELPAAPAGQIHLGSFGFASKTKNFEKICQRAETLGVHLTLLLTINSANDRTEKESRELAEEIRRQHATKNIQISVGFFSDEEIRTKLSKCSHFISAQDDSLGSSGSLRYMISLGRPVISIDNMQAREAQVYRIASLDELTLEYLRGISEPINLDDGFRYLIKFLESLRDGPLNENLTA